MPKFRFNLRPDHETGCRIPRAAYVCRAGFLSMLALPLAIATTALAQGGMPPVPAAPNALTLQQVVEQAKMKNPTLLSAQQNLLSVKAQEIQAGLRQNPYLAVEGSNVTISTSSPAGPYFYSAQLSRLFERGAEAALAARLGDVDHRSDSRPIRTARAADNIDGEAGFHHNAAGQVRPKIGSRQPEGFQA